MNGIIEIEALEQLQIDGSIVTDAGIAKLKAVDTVKLKQLSLNQVKTITDKAVDSLKGMYYLAEISVRDTGLTAKGIADLKKKEGLTVISD